VDDKDLTGVEIIVPGEREISGLVTLEGSGGIPGFLMTLTSPSASTSLVVKPEPNGSFRVKVPTDERRVRLTGIPIGYGVKSIMFGDKDLLRDPLNATEASELHVLMTVDPNVHTGSVKGRVIILPNDRPRRAPFPFPTCVKLASHLTPSAGRATRSNGFRISRFPKIFYPTCSTCDCRGAGRFEGGGCPGAFAILL